MAEWFEVKKLVLKLGGGKKNPTVNSLLFALTAGYKYAYIKGTVYTKHLACNTKAI